MRFPFCNSLDKNQWIFQFIWLPVHIIKHSNHDKELSLVVQNDVELIHAAMPAAWKRGVWLDWMLPQVVEPMQVDDYKEMDSEEDLHTIH